MKSIMKDTKHPLSFPIFYSCCYFSFLPSSSSNISEKKKWINFIESRRRDNSLCVDVDSYALCWKWHYKFTDDDNGKTVLRVDVSLHSSQVSRAKQHTGCCGHDAGYHESFTSRYNTRDDMRLRWNDKFQPKWFLTPEKIYNVEEALARWEFMEFLRKADEICLVERTFFKESKSCEISKARDFLCLNLRQTILRHVFSKMPFLLFWINFSQTSRRCKYENSKIISTLSWNDAV